LNPRPPECKRIDEELWISYASWLYRTHKRRYAKEMLRYSQKYAAILENPNLASQLLLLTKDMRRLVMSALSNLSKYTGCYDSWKETIRNYGLKWENRNGLETFLSILNTNLEETETWLKQVVLQLPKKYSTVLVFAALTGLRPSEATNSCRLITELSEQGKLDTYLDKELMMLQHFRFPDLFLRKSKNVYISFITPELLNLVLETKPQIKYSALDTRIGRLGYNNQTKQLRKIFATKLRNYLPKELIDVLQGRIGQSVFMKFYYKPLLLDIQQKTINVIRKMQNELLALLQQPITC